VALLLTSVFTTTDLTMGTLPLVDAVGTFANEIRSRRPIRMRAPTPRRTFSTAAH